MSLSLLVPHSPWPYANLEKGYDLVTGEQAPERIFRWSSAAPPPPSSIHLSICLWQLVIFPGVCSEACGHCSKEAQPVQLVRGRAVRLVLPSHVRLRKHTETILPSKHSTKDQCNIVVSFEDSGAGRNCIGVWVFNMKIREEAVSATFVLERVGKKRPSPQRVGLVATRQLRSASLF